MTHVTTAPRWRAWLSTIGILIAGLGIYLGSAIGMLALTKEPVLSMGVANLIVLGAILAWRSSKSGKQTIAQDRYPQQAFHQQFWPLVVLGLVLSWLLGQSLALWLYDLLGSTGFDASTQTKADANPAVLIITALLLAPMGEEALMRGLAYPLLRRHWRSPVGATLVTTALFSLLHNNLVQIALTVPLGILLALVYEKTRSIWPCFGLHLLFNLFSTLTPPAAIEGLATVPFILITTSATTMVLYMLHPSRKNSQEG